MDALILAAGFGTRLYPLTEKQPKALLKVNKKTIIEYLLDKIKEIEIENIYILSNNKFYINFLEWFNEFKKTEEIADKIKILTNGVNSEHGKKGAVRDLKEVLEQIDSDSFIFASDNLFDFDLKELLDLSIIKNSSTIALKVIDNIESIKKYSCVLLDENQKITYFEEKPQVPKSNICSTACYFLKKSDIKKIKNNDFENLDNLGNIIDFLHKNSIVHGVIYEDLWFDIGSIEELNKIENIFKEKNKILK